jgi:hypothetical protein
MTNGMFSKSVKYIFGNLIKYKAYKNISYLLSISYTPGMSSEAFSHSVPNMRALHSQHKL